MPLYEYACTVCGKHTEKRQKFSDPEITACPFCGSLLKRVITAPAFSFQGGGWYKDGYGNTPPPAAANKTEGAAQADGGNKAEGSPQQPAATAKSGDAASTAAAPSAPSAPAAAPASAPAASATKSE